MPHYTKKDKKISLKNSQSKLFIRDVHYVQHMMEAEQKTESEVIRELVSAGVRTRRLRAIGKDESMHDVRHAQKEVVRETLAPLIALLKEQDAFVRDRAQQTGTEYAAIEDSLRSLTASSKLMADGFKRILQNIVVIRALIWHYVTVFFHQVADSKGKKITNSQLNAMYNKEVVRAKLEAAEHKVILDEREIEWAAARFGQFLTTETANPTIAPEKERRPL